MARSSASQEGFGRAAAHAVEAGFRRRRVARHQRLSHRSIPHRLHEPADRSLRWIDFVNRIRFACETVRAVRTRRASRLSGRHSSEPGPRRTIPRTNGRAARQRRARSSTSIVAAGASFLHISGLNTPHSARARATMLPDSARRVTSVAVIANGGLDDPARARGARRQPARTDLVSLARGALANPDWPRRVAAMPRWLLTIPR